MSAAVMEDDKNPGVGVARVNQMESANGSNDQDRADMLKMGKQQVMKVRRQRIPSTRQDCR